MAVDMFMKVYRVPGESKDAAHKGWFEVISLTTGFSQPRSPSSGKAAVPRRPAAHIQDFIVTIIIDSASPVLAMALLNASVIPTVDIEICLATEDKHCVFAFELENVRITDIQYSFPPDEGPELQTLTLSLNYEIVKLVATPIDQTGLVGATAERKWNVAKNRPE